MRPLTVHTKHFPLGNYQAITLFPVIFYKDRPLTERDIRHETVHLWQQALLLVVPFYLLYFLFWIFNLVRYRDQLRAYREIPFERSAYRLEGQPPKKPIRQAFDWIKCLR
ncbi:MAG: hypothetical protein IKR33_01990 [Bacteroidales bacterium]|nr:hypothetical protein [Bacteroidales bacterium]